MSKNLVEEIRKHPNQWVALSKDQTRVVATSRSLAKALREAKAAGEPHPVMLKAPAKDRGCIL